MELEIEKYFDRLWPICRSITGNGLRESLRIISEIFPLEIMEVPTGTEVFDWTIPDEWNISDAYITTPDGKKIAEFKKNNLHVVNYSVPVDKKISHEELKAHIHTIPALPDAIPYITSYYNRNWGFCISENDWNVLPKEGMYQVKIDSELKSGSLSLGHLVLKGKTEEEILFSTYLCHPSMANNELSGPLVMAFLYKELSKIKNRKYTYRFVMVPETIGVIAYLAQFGEAMKKNTKAGYVLTCCGDAGMMRYKKSKHKTSLADRVAEHVLTNTVGEFQTQEFQVGGSDERQYCSPGFNMPVGSIMRTPYQKYPQYHTSLDNKSFISFEAMTETVNVLVSIVKVLELNEFYVNKISHCEPQLGKRDLYPHSVSPVADRRELHNLLHFLSFADGTKDLMEIAEWRHTFALDYTGIVQNCRDKNLI